METISPSRKFYTSSDLESILAVAEKWSGPAPLQKLKEGLSAQSFQLNSFLHGESKLPPETARMMKDGNYTDLREMKAIGKKLTFVTRHIIQNNAFENMLFDGEALINYGKVLPEDLTEIGGELAFISSTYHDSLHEREFVVYWKGEPFWRGKGLVRGLTEVGGIPAFAQNYSSPNRVIHGREVLNEGIYVVELINCRGQPAYATENQVFLGKEEVGEGYDEVWDLTDFNGILGFAAKKGNHQYVVMGGKKLSHKESYQVEHLWNMGGKPTILARKGNLYWMMQGEERKGGVYEGYNHREEGRLIIDSPINHEKVLDCGGKLAFPVTKFGKGIGDEETTVIFDGEEVDKYKGDVREFIQHCGELAYVMWNGKIATMIVGGEQKWKYPFIRNPTSIGEKLAFVACKGKGQDSFMVLEGEQIGEKHGGICSPIDVAGKLAYGYFDRSSSDGTSYGVVYDQRELSFLTVYRPQMKEVILQWGREYLPIGGQKALEHSLSKIKLTNAKELA
ncbi:hypothetical protein HZC30_03135 [Candidatus Woesearchaeota archaeon]|nr:hypothetical protein [Candidatus Woesearchaeota archaeon]